MILPKMGMMNRLYDAMPAEQRAETKAAVQAMMNALQFNIPGCHAAACDDMMAWFRVLGFMSDPKFMSAFEPYAEDKVLCARMWRVHTLCWAAESCMGLQGAYCD